MRSLFFTATLLFINAFAFAQCGEVAAPTAAVVDTWKLISPDLGTYPFCFGIKTDGTLWGWGHNGFRQLGDGTLTNKNYPSLTDNSTSWKIVSSGTGGAAAIRNDATLWVWGNEIYVPQQVGSDNHWLAVARGQNYPAAIKTDGTLWSWDNSYVPYQIGSSNDWVAVAAGDFHAIALRADGSIWTWGRGDNGTLGNGGFGASPQPQQVGSDHDWKSIFAGSVNSFAIKNNGTLWGWGSNSYQWGDDTTTKVYPTQIGNATDWVSLSSSGFHSVGIKTDGSLWSWGRNYFGEQANGAYAGDFLYEILQSPAQLGTDHDWKSATASFGYTMATKNDGSLWSWGLNDYGQLGFGGTDYKYNTIHRVNSKAVLSFQDKCTPSTIADLNVMGTNIRWYESATANSTLSPTTLLANDAHYFATQTIGGCESSARLEVITVRATPTPPPSASAGQTFCYGATLRNLIVTGNLIRFYDANVSGNELSVTTTLKPGVKYFATQTFGSCESARLEIEPIVNHTLPPLATPNQSLCRLHPFTDLAVSGKDIKIYLDSASENAIDIRYALLNSDHYYISQTQNGCESVRINVPVSLFETPAPTGASVQEFCSTGKLKDLKVNGTSIQWYLFDVAPLNPESNLGNGWTFYATQTVNSCESLSRLAVTSILTPNEVPRPVYEVPNTWSSISTMSRNTVGVKTDGTLWGWGDNYEGQLGTGTSRDVVTQTTLIGTDRDWKMVSGGGQFTSAIKDDGTLWTWGLAPVTSLVPTQVGTDNDWRSVSSGYGHILAIKQNGTLWSWGRNDNGQLGDGTFTDKSIPVQIGTDTHWSSVSAGLLHSMALQTDGSLWTWGDGYYRTLGNGDPTLADKNTPQHIGIDNDWRSVFGGSLVSFAIKKNGTLWGWGINTFGEMGSTGFFEFPIPTQIGNDTWQTIAGDSGPSFHTLAINSRGQLWGWGFSKNGELGDGVISSSYLPPHQVGIETTWLAVGSGEGFSIGIKNDGSLWSWGYNNYGSLGIPEAYRNFIPTRVPSGAATPAQLFCTNASVADLKAGGSQIAWYAHANDTIPLSAATALQNNAHYFATQTIGLCTSLSRLDIVVLTRSSPPPAPTGQATQTFCTGAVISDLEAQTNNGGQLRWYGQSAGGTQLSVSDALVNHKTYYASQKESICESTGRFAVTPVVNPLPPAPTGDEVQRFAGSANVADLVAEGSDVHWYLYPADPTQLAPTYELTNDTAYYASQTVLGCESTDRLRVTVMLITGAGESNDGLTYYPNPTSGVVNISFPEKITELTVLDPLGIPVLSQIKNDQEVQLDINTLPSGVYVVRIKGRTRSALFKVIRE